MIRPDKTFCALPHVDLAGLAAHGADLAILGAAHGTPYKPGTPSHACVGAAAIRGALEWYSTRRAHLDMDHGGPLLRDVNAVDIGDVKTNPDDDGTANRAAIREAVSAIRAAGAVPLLLGGDDSVPIPFYEGFSGDEVWILQIDAHVDWRHEVEGVTHGFSSTMRRASEMAQVKGIVQVGARGVGSARAGELADADSWGAQIFPMRLVHQEGLGPVLAAIPQGARVILNIDADGLDPALCPGVLSPAYGGLSYQEMLDLIEGVAVRGTIAGATMVEYVAENDPQGRGAHALARLLCNLIAAVERR